MQNKYRKTIELNYWCVSKADLVRIYNFIVERFGGNKPKIEVLASDGNTREITSIKELDLVIDDLLLNKEKIAKLEIVSFLKSKQKSKLVMFEVDFNHSLYPAKFVVVSEDKDGSNKDWVVGVHEEIKKIFASFGDGEDFTRLLEEKYSQNGKRDNVIIFDYDGTIKSSILAEIQNLKKKTTGEIVKVYTNSHGSNVYMKVFWGLIGSNKITKHLVYVLIIVAMLIILVAWLGYSVKSINVGPFELQPPDNNIPSGAAEVNQINLSELVYPEPNLDINLRELTPLETGKLASELPDNIYGYDIGSGLAYDVNSGNFGSKMDLTNIQKSPWYFEINKIEGKYYILGFVGQEFYSTVNSATVTDPKTLTLFATKNELTNYIIAIPFDNILEIKDREIDYNKQEIMVLDIKTTKVLTNFQSHSI